MDPYRDIAAFYDCEHEGFEDDVTFFLNAAGGGPVLEVGTGTGRIAVPLAEAGHEVWAVDPSAAMLERARLRIGGRPGVHLVHGTVHDLVAPVRFNTAILPLNTLWHIGDLDERLRSLGTLKRHINPDGLLIVDQSNPLSMADRGAAGELRLRYQGECEGGRLIATSAAWDDEAAQTLDLTLIYDRTAPAGTVRATAALQLRYIYRQELELLLRLAGFRPRHFYGSYDLDPYEAGSERLIAVAAPDGGP